MDRRSFLRLTAASAAVAITPDIANAMGVFEDPVGTWLPCDGRILHRADFPELFRVIGTNYGRTPTEFRLPDMRSYTVSENRPTEVSEPMAVIKVKPEDGESDFNAPVGMLLMVEREK